MQTTCDLCGVNVSEYPDGEPRQDYLANQLIDGKTRRGSWAWMCKSCHALFGVGLGTGRGQKYNTLTGKKIEG